MTIAAPGTPWQLVVCASRYCPELLAECSCTATPAVASATSWCVGGGGLALGAQGLSYTRRTFVEPRWAYTEHIEAPWPLVHLLLRQLVAGALLVAMRAAHLEHRRLERELAERAQDAAAAWTGPDVAARIAATNRARRQLVEHTRTTLGPLVQAALATAVPNDMEEDVETLTLDTTAVDEPIPYTLAEPGLALCTAPRAVDPLAGAARELYADVCWLSAGQALSVEALVEGLAALGWQKLSVRS
jgi:hypothetical protein